jgi:4-amino-4-deoxy-L-arabinose transferase-like glycosyltransferase
MFWARLPFILLAGLLGVLIYVWTRELAGNNAALGALFLYALDPTIVAHSFLVTTDVGLAAFSMLFLWTVWRYVNQPTRRGLVICGLAMGAMLGAKFSALFMVASAAVLAAGRDTMADRRSRGRGAANRTEQPVPLRQRQEI